MTKKTYIGETRTMNNGQQAKVLPSSKNSKDVTVQFEDGTVVRHVQLQHFREGKVANINAVRRSRKKRQSNDFRIGEERLMRCGKKAVITEYRTAKDITVYFPEEDVTVTHKAYDSFIRGAVRPCSDRVGEKRRMNNGELAEITEYLSAKNITVFFPETGTYAYNKRYDNFINGHIRSVEA